MRITVHARRLLCTILLLLVTVVANTSSQAQVSRVLTLADSLDGAVGGVAVDGLGIIYSADFGDSVWRIRPDGRVSEFASGFYGSSGNAIDRFGNLFQSNFTGNYLSRVDRNGHHEIIVREGLEGPVGVAVDGSGSLYVNNCRGNSISRIDSTYRVEEFAVSELFNCPNGITAHTDGNLYVVNFSDGNMLRIEPDRTVSVFAVIPGGGNGHIAVARGHFYVTGFASHRIYQVTMDGRVTHVAGSGVIGETDGPALEATFTFPNGIAAGPRGDRLIVNEFINRFPPSTPQPPRAVSNIRVILLSTISDVMVAGFQSGGIPAMVDAHQSFKSDPATARLYTEIEVNILGYSMMQNGQLPAAIRIFELNVEDYPNSANVYDSLGEAYMIAGRDADAILAYERSLERNSANQNAIDMIEKIRSK